MILPPRGASVDTQRRSELRAALDPQEVIQRIDKLVDCDQVRLTDIFSDEDVHQLCDVLKIKCGIKSSRKSPFEGVCEVMDEEIITVKKPRNNKGRFTFEQFQMMPDEIQYRSIRYRITGRTEVITIVTTLVDSKQFSAEDIAEVYGLRWDVETDIACWKTTMGFPTSRDPHHPQLAL